MTVVSEIGRWRTDLKCLKMETTRIPKMKFLNQTGAAKPFPVTVVRSSLTVVLMSAITTLTALATSYLYTFQDENVHHTVLGC